MTMKRRSNQNIEFIESKLLSNQLSLEPSSPMNQSITATNMNTDSSIPTKVSEAKAILNKPSKAGKNRREGKKANPKY